MNSKQEEQSHQEKHKKIPQLWLKKKKCGQPSLTFPLSRK